MEVDSVQDSYTLVHQPICGYRALIGQFGQLSCNLLNPADVDPEKFPNQALNYQMPFLPRHLDMLGMFKSMPKTAVWLENE